MYGWQTRSWRHSTEKRQLDKERAEITARYLVEQHPSVEIRSGMCNCRSFRFAHDPEQHRELSSDFDWIPWEDRC